LELQEELGIHSPVRHFTPPHCRAFCVIAKKDLKCGEFVFCYAGEITEEVEHRDSAYVYQIEQSQVRRTVRSYHGPDLTLDALKVGNISRFVNDNTYRAGESSEGDGGGKGSTANLETQFLFQKGSIHLGFYLTRDVVAGEELISQYGEEYWKCLNKQLILEHEGVFRYLEPYTRLLEKQHFNGGLELPAEPKKRWTGPDEFFRSKPVPYPDNLSDFSRQGQHARTGGGRGAAGAGGEADDDGLHEVERILQERRDVDSGSLEYYVKWKHCPSADNSWIKSSQIIHCQELIDEFRETQRNKRVAGAAASSSTSSSNYAAKSHSKPGSHAKQTASKSAKRPHSSRR
jgi:hypothetical protein